MLQQLTAPYPFNRNVKAELIFMVATGAFIALFLIIFQPFGTHNFKSDYKNLFLSGYGIVVSSVFLLCRFALPTIVPKAFKEETWSVGKHILWLLFSFSLCIYVCYVYKGLFLGHSIALSGFSGFYFIAMSIAIFPITAYVLTDYINQLKKYQSRATNINEHLDPVKQEVENIESIDFKDEGGKIQLSLSSDQVLFLQSADNYVEIFHRSENKVKKTIIRNTLKQIEPTIPVDIFERTHRSFLVNLSNVNKVSGNAQGYKLHFEGLDTAASVARSKGKMILEKIENMKS